MTKKIELLEKKLKNLKDPYKKTDILIKIVELQRQQLDREYQLLGAKFVK